MSAHCVVKFNPTFVRELLGMTTATDVREAKLGMFLITDLREAFLENLSEVLLHKLTIEVINS